MTNRWNQLIYRFWSPVYDLFFDRLLFASGRKRTFELLQLRGEERVLLVGVGTGADLSYLPKETKAVGVDLSPEMLRKAKDKFPETGSRFLIRADAQNLPVREASFDVVILTLILSVVPDGQACWRESLRALHPGGRAIIFDKFLPDKQSSNPVRALLNLGAKLLGTDINRRLGEILAGTEYTIVHEEPSLLNGMYRIILIRS
ncbi:MAG TPA: methyltransferase domain-containing protein [Anaerolineales bacterium]|nr:methyltransferase domain-containing protein [Anaerolineales bacterium]